MNHQAAKVASSNSRLPWPPLAFCGRLPPALSLSKCAARFLAQKNEFENPLQGFRKADRQIEGKGLFGNPEGIMTSIEIDNAGVNPPFASCPERSRRAALLVFRPEAVRDGNIGLMANPAGISNSFENQPLFIIPQTALPNRACEFAKQGSARPIPLKSTRHEQTYFNIIL